MNRQTNKQSGRKTERLGLTDSGRQRKGEKREGASDRLINRERKREERRIYRQTCRQRQGESLLKSRFKPATYAQLFREPHLDARARPCFALVDRAQRGRTELVHAFSPDFCYGSNHPQSQKTRSFHWWRQLGSGNWSMSRSIVLRFTPLPFPWL